MAREGNSLYIDASDLQQKIALMRNALTRNQMERLLHRTFGEVGRRGATIIARAAVQDYAVTQAWVRSQVQRYRLQYGGSSPVTCTIPINGHRGTIGGRYAASGRGGRIRARIVRTGQSTLPATMDHQGGNPPFISQGGAGAGVAFTRRTRRRLPIVRVVGLGVPQMPLNRSDSRVTHDLLDLANRRLEHNFQYMFGSGG